MNKNKFLGLGFLLFFLNLNNIYLMDIERECRLPIEEKVEKWNPFRFETPLEKYIYKHPDFGKINEDSNEIITYQSIESTNIQDENFEKQTFRVNSNENTEQNSDEEEPVEQDYEEQDSEVDDYLIDYDDENPEDDNFIDNNNENINEEKVLIRPYEKSIRNLLSFEGNKLLDKFLKNKKIKACDFDNLFFGLSRAKIKYTYLKIFDFLKKFPIFHINKNKRVLCDYCGIYLKIGGQNAKRHVRTLEHKDGFQEIYKCLKSHNNTKHVKLDDYSSLSMKMDNMANQILRESGLLK